MSKTHLIALSLTEGVGPILAKKIISYTSSPEAIVDEKWQNLMRIPGVGQIVAKNIANNFQNHLERAQLEQEIAEKNSWNTYSYLDKDYPQKLRVLDDSPLVLFSDHKLKFNQYHTISIVGTRKATDYGKRVCEELVEALKEIGVIVLSGLAYGIDICAHKASIKNEVQTVGCLAHGLDQVYPSVHTKIATQMREKGGGLITEFLTNTRPDRENFPKRNRIVSGISDATVVVESSLKGGSMITANLSNDYNKDVFAVPGKITDEFSKGCNELIRTNRAHLYQSPTELINMMGWIKTEKEKIKNVQRQLFLDLQPSEEKIVDVLKGGKVDLDQLSYKTSLTQSELMVHLFNLEMNGIIKNLPGKVVELI